MTRTPPMSPRVAALCGLAVAMVLPACGTDRSLSLDRDRRDLIDGTSRSERAVVAASPRTAPREADATDAGWKPSSMRDTTRCDAMAVAPVGSKWLSYHDDQCHGDDSDSTAEAFWEEDRTVCVTTWKGHVSNFDEDTFASVQTGLRRDLSKAKSLRFQSRGTGEEVRVQFHRKYQLDKWAEDNATKSDFDIDEDEACDEEWVDFYGQDFYCGDGSDRWQTIDIDLAHLRQRGWGRKVPLDLNDMVQMELVTLHRPIEHFSCQFKLFEVVP